MGYYILMAFNILIVALLVITFIRMVLLFFDCKKNYLEQDIVKELSPKKNKHVVKVLLFTILFAALIGGKKLAENYLTGTTNIVMTYPEASNGLNPNGSRFNLSAITSNEILEKAISYGNTGYLTVEQLKEALSVIPAKEEEDVTKQMKEKSLVSAQCVLKFNPTKDTGLTNGQAVVNAVALAYYNWFVEKYGQNYACLDMVFNDLTSYDYQDYPTYFDAKIATLCDFAEAFYQKDAGYISKETGKDFCGLKEESWDLRNTSLEKLKAYIIENGLSKNNLAYMGRLRYSYIKESRKYQSSLADYKTRVTANQRYDDDMATVLYIPTYDLNDQFYMSKTRIGIDEFSRTADELSASGAASLDEMLDSQYRMQMLNNTSGTDEQFAEADRMATELVEDIDRIAKSLKATTQDYIRESSNDYIVFAGPSTNDVFGVKSVIAIVSFAIMLYFLYGFQGLKKLGMKEERRAKK